MDPTDAEYRTDVPDINELPMTGGGDLIWLILVAIVMIVAGIALYRASRSDI